MAVVSVEIEDGIGVITIDNPPVNAASQAMREGVRDAVARLNADPAVLACVLRCAGRTFVAGADIREMGRPRTEPFLRTIAAAIDASPKPYVAAVHGTAFGGGFELAMASHYRVAVPSAQFALPEVKIGVLPGAHGTQRLPRLVGLEQALRMMLTGDPITAQRALELGAIDEIATGDLRAAALAAARRLVREGRPLRRTSRLPGPALDQALIDRAAAEVRRRRPGEPSPGLILKCIVDACTLPFDEGVRNEAERSGEVHKTPEAAALRHAFFAEREVARVPGLPADAAPRPVRKVGVVGFGTMGGGIAMTFANAGLPVVVCEAGQTALDAGWKRVLDQYATSVSRGTTRQVDADQRIARISRTLALEDLADCDLVVEAVFERMDVKKEVLARLDAVMRPGAIIATNTSNLDVDEMAAATRRPGDVVGLHFFAPAQVMRLLEVVRGRETAPDVVATSMKLARTLGKVGVVSGVCFGFIGNRISAQRRRESLFLVEEGALPQDVDRVLREFGFPMGMFEASDLSGLDVLWQSRRNFAHLRAPGVRDSTLVDLMHDAGRLGQKNGKGWYRYPDGRKAQPDPEVERMLVEHSARLGIQRRAIADDEILERILYAMVNEAARILDEGIAARPHDIDMVWIHGFGFPRRRGGPMFWANQVGLPRVLEAIQRLRERHGAGLWTPAPLIDRLVREGRGFY